MSTGSQRNYGRGHYDGKKEGKTEGRVEGAASAAGGIAAIIALLQIPAINGFVKQAHKDVGILFENFFNKKSLPDQNNQKGRKE